VRTLSDERAAHRRPLKGTGPGYSAGQCQCALPRAFLALAQPGGSAVELGTPSLARCINSDRGDINEPESHNNLKSWGETTPILRLAATRCGRTMSVMAANAFINCRVTSQTKTLARALAERQGITESALLKELLEGALRTASLGEPPAPAPPERVNRNARLTMRLKPDDWMLLKERAQARRMPSATYVSLLVRSHLRAMTPLPKAEYIALKQSVAELAAIGRNLNQIARAVNHGERTASPGQAEVRAMLKVAVGLRDHFRGLLTANERSWTAP
jgi:mobilization protein MobC